MSKSTGRGQRFTKGSGCYECKGCGKLTRDDGQGDSVHVRLCTRCYEEAGLENEHQDGGHRDGAVEGCPMCREVAAQAEGKAEAIGEARLEASYAREIAQADATTDAPEIPAAPEARGEALLAVAIGRVAAALTRIAQVARKEHALATAGADQRANGDLVVAVTDALSAFNIATSEAVRAGRCAAAEGRATIGGAS